MYVKVVGFDNGSYTSAERPPVATAEFRGDTEQVVSGIEAWLRANPTIKAFEFDTLG